MRVRSQSQRFDLAEKRRALDALNITVLWYPDKPPDIHGSIPMRIVTNAVACTALPPQGYALFSKGLQAAQHRVGGIEDRLGEETQPHQLRSLM